MSVLLEKIRKAREQKVEAGGFTFTVRRPTDLEMMEMRGTGSVGRLLPFVVGWDGVKELDVIPGGDPHPIAFDADVCKEWLSDRPDILGPVVEKLMQAYDEHIKAVEGAAKN